MNFRKTTELLADLDERELVDELLAKATGGATCINLPPSCFNVAG